MSTSTLAPTRIWSRWWAGLRSKFTRLLSQRAGRSLPIVLIQKRLYVLPTAFGCFSALILFVSVLGSLNYNNNLALAFSFLFAAVMFLSVHVAHRNLLRLSVQTLQAHPAYAGGTLAVDVGLQADDLRARTCLKAHFENAPEVDFELPAPSSVRLELPAERRGWQVLPPLSISTQWPFGLFVVWSHVWPQVEALVYPKLDPHAPELPMHLAHTDGHASRKGDEELRHLRDYQPGDAPRQIAWRASARTGELRTREMQSHSASDVVLDLRQIHGINFEEKLSRLAAWCVRAESQGLRFELRGVETGGLGMGSGPQHLRACLKSLALAP